MIKDNQKKLNRIHVLLDVVMTVLAYFLAWLIIVSGKVIPLEYNVKTLEPPVYFAALIFIIPVYLVLNVLFSPLCAEADPGTQIRVCQHLQGQCDRPYVLYADPVWRKKYHYPPGIFLHQDASLLFRFKYPFAGSGTYGDPPFSALSAHQRL